MTMKTQIIVLLSLSITIGMMGSAYANEQYPGLDENDILYFFGDDGITTDLERGNAVLASDYILAITDRISEISTPERAEFWSNNPHADVLPEDDITLRISYLSDVEEFEFDILIDELYPESNAYGVTMVWNTESATISVIDRSDEFPHMPDGIITMYFGDDGINTPVEHANAVLLDDATHALFGRSSEISNQDRAAFWTIHSSAIVGPGEYYEIAVGFEADTEITLSELTTSLQALYPDAIISTDFIVWSSDSEDDFDDVVISDDRRTTSNKYSKQQTLNRELGTTNFINIGSINVARNLTIDQIQVDLKYVADIRTKLYVYLTAPNGETHRIYKDTINSGLNTISVSQSTETRMNNFVGDSAQGDWILKIRDRGSTNGEIKYWKLTITPTNTTPTPTIDNDVSVGATIIPKTSLIDWIVSWYNQNFSVDDQSCTSIHDDCDPLYAGMKFGVELEPNTRGDVANHGSIGLGGVMTDDGKQGFITARHVIGDGRTDLLVYHSITVDKSTNPYTINKIHPIGITTTPDLPRDKHRNVDASFVEYGVDCGETYATSCIGPGEVLPTVEHMRIFVSSDTIYEVDGTHMPLSGSVVLWIGEVTGTENSILKMNRPTEVKLDTDGIYNPIQIYRVNTGSVVSQDGDSGGPVYVVEDGKAKMVGIIKGHSETSRYQYIAVTPWDVIESELGLRSLS